VATSGAFADLADEPVLPSQAEAEAGTATTARLWSAQRVAQAISALESGGGGSSTAVWGIAVSDEDTDLEVQTSAATFRMPQAMTVSEVRASLTDAPVGQALIVDVLCDGSSLFTTNLLSIDAAERTSETATTAANLTTTSIADDCEMTVDIDQVGSTSPGVGLKIVLIGTWQ